MLYYKCPCPWFPQGTLCSFITVSCQWAERELCSSEMSSMRDLGSDISCYPIRSIFVEVVYSPVDSMVTDTSSGIIFFILLCYYGNRI